jgi:hypothetical protein
MIPHPSSRWPLLDMQARERQGTPLALMAGATKSNYILL